MADNDTVITEPINGSGVVNADNVVTGAPRINGGIYRAPKGTPVPTDATSPLDSAFENMGYISDEGVVNSSNKTSTDIKEWGGAVVKTVGTGLKDTYKQKFIEALNPVVLETTYGKGNVTVADDGSIAIKSGAVDTGEAVYVIDEVNGDRLYRTVIPRGTIESIGDITHKPDTPKGYELTIACGRDSSGYTHYEYYSAPIEDEETQEEEDTTTGGGEG